MKKNILILILTLCLSSVVSAQKRLVTVTGENNTLQQIEVRDTIIKGKKVTDTLSVTIYLTSEDADTKVKEAVEEAKKAEKAILQSEFNAARRIDWDDIISVITVFSMPVFIVLIVFYYKNKNRQAKYNLAQQALANGQPIPESLFKEESQRLDFNGNRVKGIRNVFLGIGLAIFLWMLTDEASLACIGLLIMFTGVGQLVIYYTSPTRKEIGTPSTPTEKNPVE